MRQNSKSVLKVPTYILIVGKILQFISNDLATRYASKLFTSPIKYKIPKRETKMLSNSSQKLIKIEELDESVMVYNYGKPSDKKILLVHGWSGRGTQLFKIADKLIESGYQIISFDAPAHGFSTGKTTMMNEFVIVIHQLEKEFGKFKYAVGHSLGGMALINVVNQGLSINKLVTIGSADSIYRIIDNFIKTIDLKSIISEKLKLYYNNIFGEEIENFASSKAAKNVLIPTLIIHDKDDFEVSVNEAYSIHNNLSNSKLLITEKLGHRKILRDEKVINHICKFLNN